MGVLSPGPWLDFRNIQFGFLRRFAMKFRHSMLMNCLLDSCKTIYGHVVVCPCEVATIFKQMSYGAS